MKTALELVCEGLARRQTPVLLIGGYALAAYDVVRQTVDVDFLIADNQEHDLHDLLLHAGYVERQRTDAFARYSHAEPVLMDVDVMLVDRDTFSKMHAKSVRQRVGGVEMQVPCLAHLIALKLHALKNNPKRELKDLGDIAALLTENAGAVPRAEMQAICQQYGPEGVFTKVEVYL
jgi:predicted nucleotidyltransferase